MPFVSKPLQTALTENLGESFLKAYIQTRATVGAKLKFKGIFFPWEHLYAKKVGRSHNSFRNDAVLKQRSLKRDNRNALIEGIV